MGFFFTAEEIAFPASLLLRIANAEFRFLLRWGCSSSSSSSSSGGGGGSSSASLHLGLAAAEAAAAAAGERPQPPLAPVDYLAAFKKTIRQFKTLYPPVVKTQQQEINYKRGT